MDYRKWQFCCCSIGNGVRIIAIFEVEYYTLNPVRRMGAPGTVVQLDETCVVRRKFNQGRLVRKDWLVGGIQEGTRMAFFEITGRRNAATLQAIIQRHVAPGGILLTDQWAGYANLGNLGYTHRTALVCVVAGVVLVAGPGMVSWAAHLLLAAAVIHFSAALFLFLGVSLSQPKLLIPSLLLRAAALFIVQGCGLSAVFSAGDNPTDSALVLVAAVFALLLFALLSIYFFYLSIHCIRYLKQLKKLTERRSSYIEAAIMEEMHYESRRASNAEAAEGIEALQPTGVSIQGS